MPIYPYSFTMPPVNKQDIPSDGVVGEFLGISAGGVLDWLPVSGGGGSGDMLAANNLSELTNDATARTNIGLGTTDSPEFANLTLTSPSLSSSAPVTISQTWGNSGQTFKAFVVNAAGTSAANSASGSLLLDLQVGGTSVFKVSKTGSITANNTINLAGSIVQSSGNFIPSNALIFDYFNQDVVLQRDGAANTLALRNGAAAQTFNVYGTYSTSPSLAYARLAISCDTSGNATLTTQSTGLAGTVSINGVPVGLGKGNVSSNIAIGTNALNANTTGSRNVAIGNESLLSVTTGLANTAIGAGALKVAASGSIANSAIGDLALTYCVGSTYNTAIGQGAGTFVLSGATLSTSSYSVFIGPDAKANSNGETNQIAIGYNAQGIGSNSVVLGNDSITKTALKGNVGIGTTAPRTKLHLEDTSTNTLVEFSGPTVRNFTGVGFAPNVGTNTCGRIGQSSIANGGLAAYGFTSNTNAVPAVTFQGNLGSASPTIAAIYFDSYKTNGSTGRVALAATEISSQFANGDSPLMTVLGGGNVGIGTTSPTSKLQVSAGDVEVDTIAKGVILKSPDGTRYRVTVANGGTLSVAAA